MGKESEAEEDLRVALAHVGAEGCDGPPADRTEQLAAAEEEAPPPTFIASETFEGLKMGYVFGRGEQGQGYYADELTKEKPEDWATYET